jgi:anaerobic ribonucleoside-triphosphate reductase activating protein
MIFKCAGVSDSMNDGLGKIALDVFFQGCSLKCPGCQNPDLQDFRGGSWWNTAEIFDILKENKDFYQAMVFLGGEPLEQPSALIELASKSKVCNVLYTGWIYDKIPNKIRSLMDVIIDGPYIESQKSCGFPASSNQRIYHM